MVMELSPPPPMAEMVPESDQLSEASPVSSVKVNVPPQPKSPTVELDPPLTINAGSPVVLTIRTAR